MIGIPEISDTISIWEVKEWIACPWRYWMKYKSGREILSLASSEDEGEDFNERSEWSEIITSAHTLAATKEAPEELKDMVGKYLISDEFTEIAGDTFYPGKEYQYSIYSDAFLTREVIVRCSVDMYREVSEHRVEAWFNIITTNIPVSKLAKIPMHFLSQVYSAIVMEKMEGVQVDVVLNFFGKRKAGGTVAQYPLLLSDDSKEAFFSYVNALIFTMQEEWHYPRRLGSWNCNGCPLQNDCYTSLVHPHMFSTLFPILLDSEPEEVQEADES